MSKEFRAVTIDELIKLLGSQCSPSSRYLNAGYVIGPDINGRISHVATCSSLGEAQARANLANSKKEK